MLTELKAAAGGVKSYMPFLPFFGSYRGTGGSDSSRYCYSVWLRHLTLIGEAGLPGPMDSIVELGPGDSLGVGIAALLTGAKRYIALDVVPHADTQTNLAVFDSLVELFQRREPIPGDSELPGVHPRLPDYAFPIRHLNPDLLRETLAPGRLARIRASIAGAGSGQPESMIRYVCPWYEDSLAEAGTVDVILSQVALQDIEELDHAYGIMTKWLKPRGVMSHQIDFSFPGSDTYWNEHWAYPDFLWKITRGKRPFYFNRAPFSKYLEVTERHGHAIRQTLPVEDRRSLPRTNANARFRHLSERDFATSSAYILSTNGD
ncbi:MAG: hypothetical protein C5B51_27495 [Terriglobia bacterium]|nr:MAG: hypothetical protein C5B51_27495 [Terriglobia bacterium]